MKNLTPIVRIVDDDPTVCESQSFFLQLAGFQTVTYQDPKQFLEQDDWERPGCIILDVRMPGLSGIEVQQTLNEAGVNLPIIFLSAHGDIEMAMSCVEKGAFNFLVKPPEPEKLQSLVTKAVEKNKQDRRQRSYVESLKRSFEQLTAAEKTVAHQIAKGMTNLQISELLSISDRTVQTHRARIYQKLDVENPVELNEFIREMSGL